MISYLVVNTTYLGCWLDSYSSEVLYYQLYTYVISYYSELLSKYAMQWRMICDLGKHAIITLLNDS